MEWDKLYLGCKSLKSLPVHDEEILQLLVKFLEVSAVCFQRDLVNQDQSVLDEVLAHIMKVEPIAALAVEIGQNQPIRRFAALDAFDFLLCYLGQKGRLAGSREPEIA